MSSSQNNDVSSSAALTAVSGPASADNANNSQTAVPRPGPGNPTYGIGKNVVSHGIGKTVSRGKGGKFSGKGAALRHQHDSKRQTHGTNPSRFRKMARRAGITAVGGGVYSKMIQEEMAEWTRSIIRDVIIVMDHGRRKTAMKIDLFYALQRRRRTIYK